MNEKRKPYTITMKPSVHALALRIVERLNAKLGGTLRDGGNGVANFSTLLAELIIGEAIKRGLHDPKGGANDRR